MDFKKLTDWDLENEKIYEVRGKRPSSRGGGSMGLSNQLEDKEAEAIWSKHATLRTKNKENYWEVDYEGIKKDLDEIKDQQKKDELAQDMYSAGVDVAAQGISAVLQRLIGNAFDRTKKRETRSDLKSKEAKALVDQQLKALNSNINSLELELRDAKNRFDAADILANTIRDRQQRKIAKKVRKSEEDRIKALEKRLQQAKSGRLSL